MLQKTKMRGLRLKKSLIQQGLALIILSIVIALIIAWIFSTQRLTQNSQDIRQQASIDQGLVEVSVLNESGSQLIVNQLATLTIKVNTQSTQTDGVQLVFNVITQTFTTPPELTLISPANLNIAFKEIIPNADGFAISFIAVPAQIGQAYSTSSAENFAQLTFTPVQTGSIQLKFDATSSIATVFESNPPQDELKTITDSSFTVISSQVNVVQSVVPTPEATPTPTTEATPTPTPSSSLTQVGGIILKNCNESCTSNDECINNHYCASGVCRLVTNPSSETCSAPADAGLNYDCNHYCADSNECKDSLTCWNNRCRNPENTENESCTPLTNTQKAVLLAACNQSCTSHADCVANLMCYGGICRLASNPTNSSCIFTSSKNNSVLTTSKGGLANSMTTPLPTASTPSIMTSGKNNTDANITASPSPITQRNSNLSAATSPVRQSALELVLNSLSPYLIPIAAGIGLIIALIILSLIFLKKKKSQNSTAGNHSFQNLEKKLSSPLISKGTLSTSTQAATTLTPAASNHPLSSGLLPSVQDQVVSSVISAPISTKESPPLTTTVTSANNNSIPQQPFSVTSTDKTKDIYPPVEQPPSS